MRNLNAAFLLSFYEQKLTNAYIILARHCTVYAFESVVEWRILQNSWATAACLPTVLLFASLQSWANHNRRASAADPLAMTNKEDEEREEEALDGELHLSILLLTLKRRLVTAWNTMMRSRGSSQLRVHLIL